MPIYNPVSSDEMVKMNYTFPSVVLQEVPGILFNSKSQQNIVFEQYTIKLKVDLYHNGEHHDLTPYIMQVKTHMGMGEDSGRFTLLLNFKKRWDLFIQPQDYVEIAFSRYLKTPPIIMRGLVGNPRRTRVMDDSGRLHRAITVNGENMGKAWKEYQLQYLVTQPGNQSHVGTDTDPAIQFMYPLMTENFGIGNGKEITNILCNDLMTEITDKLLNAQIKTWQQVNPQIPLITVKPSASWDYQIIGLNLNQVSGNVFSFIKEFGNAPWCEWVMDDFTEGPVFIYRNTPFKKKDGTYPDSSDYPDHTYFPDVIIHNKDIMEEDVGKSDAEAYSYYLTYPNSFYMNQANFKAAIVSQLTAATEADTQNITNPHVDLQSVYRYGFKMLQLGSYAIPLSESKGAQDQTSFDLALRMNQWLVDVFSWNPDMLNGTLRMKGNEHARIGRYLINESENEEYYIESVDHEITIGQVGSVGNDNVYNFQTSVGVTRGRGIS